MRPSWKPAARLSVPWDEVIRTGVHGLAVKLPAHVLDDCAKLFVPR